VSPVSSIWLEGVSLEIALGAAALLLTALCAAAFGALVVQARTRRRVEEVALRIAELDRAAERSERGVREELQKNREETSGAGRLLREEVNASIQRFGDSFGRGLGELRGVVDAHLEKLREENGRKLDAMRQTVDEKLQGALEKRLGDAFQQVSQRLEAVHQGLGEMQALAVGVGDLKKVLTNVRTRGSFGEVQLGALLEQILSPNQYETQVATRPGGSERVDFAVRLPGAEADADTPVWLPIDAKFPQDDFERFVDAHEKGDAAAAEEAGRALEARVRSEARSIRDKYVCPPHTTDFALMFLPTEALCAEVLRRPGLVDGLMRECRVSVTGPTTLAALLSSLQMGFRTLAIQKRSDEVWRLLGAVRTHFGKFGDLLDRVDKKLLEASSTIGRATAKTRYIERRLSSVETLPDGAAQELLPELADEPPGDVP
jgi:DNA recombination protein RmuC